MNCDDFFVRWNGHVAGTLEPWRETEMQEHARACAGCGKRWTEHGDLCLAVDSVITAHRLPANLANTVLGKLKFPAVTRAAQAGGAAAASSFPAPVVSLATAAIGGLVLGYLLGGGGGRGYMQLTQQALYGELIGNGSLRGAGSVLGLWSAMDCTNVVLGVVFLLWITRTRIWAALFPVKVPSFIGWARWLSIPACVIGILQILCALMMLMAAGMNSLTYTGSQDLGMWLTGASFLQPLWNLGFWLTLLVMLLGAINEAALRFARPLQ